MLVLELVALAQDYLDKVEKLVEKLHCLKVKKSFMVMFLTTENSIIFFVRCGHWCGRVWPWWSWSSRCWKRLEN